MRSGSILCQEIRSSYFFRLTAISKNGRQPDFPRLEAYITVGTYCLLRQMTICSRIIKWNQSPCQNLLLVRLLVENGSNMAARVSFVTEAHVGSSLQHICVLALTKTGSSTLDYRRAVGSREIQALDQIKSFPRLDVMICGPKLYVLTKDKKLSALQASQALLPFILPQQPEHQFGYLWHNDLHDENIFVDPQNPTTITGIIDWQSTQIVPLYDHILEPSFLDYSGPELDNALTRPELPQT